MSAANQAVTFRAYGPAGKLAWQECVRGAVQEETGARDSLWRERLIRIDPDLQAREDDERWLAEGDSSFIGADGEWVALEDRERVGDDDRAHDVHGSNNNWDKWLR
jgi:hypothetical protein